MQILSDKKIKEVFTNIPELETERLILRKILPSDAEDMFRYSCLPAVTEYLTWHCHKTQKETGRYIALLQRKYALGAFWDFGIEYKKDGRFIGTCGFTSFDKDLNRAEIGYVISPDYRGKGIAAEAASAVMRFGFAVFDVDRICARFIDGNNASLRVIEKLGMTHEHTYKNSFYIKNEYKTVHEYSVGKKDFFGRE